MPSRRSLSVLLFATSLAAQGLHVGPEPTPVVVDSTVSRPQPMPLAPQNGGVSVALTKVRATIDDGVASTEIEQTLRNSGGRPAEATWFLPLPAGAMADGFTMMVGDQLLRGEVLDAANARGVYEQIVRQRRDPGLLEYAGEGLLRARVFPIPAQGEVVVKVRFRQVLQPTGGIHEWSWPLRAARFGATTNGPLSLDLTIRSSTAIKTLFSTLSEARIDRHGEGEARVSFELRSGGADRDLRVLYGLSENDFGLHLLTYRKAEEPGYFVMLLSPKRDWSAEAGKTRRCIQFVLDVSGSMRGVKMVQARAALSAFVRSLPPTDLFNVVPFSTDARPFYERPRLADAATVVDALHRIEGLEANGGTNIEDALTSALASEVPPDATGAATLLPITVFVTDGQPTLGVTAEPQLLELINKANKHGARVFVFGVGNEVNTRLLDQLAEQQHGARDYVREDENIEVKTSALFSKVAQPVLTDVEVRCDELDGFDVFPAKTRDLFAGDSLQLAGRYRGAGAKTIHVRGKVAGVAKEFTFTTDFPALATRYDFVPSVWAQKKVLTLLDAIRLHGANRELIDEVRRLSQQFGIATPYTSHLILEEGMRLGAMPPRGPNAGHPVGVNGGPGPVGPPSAGPSGAVNHGPSSPRGATAEGDDIAMQISSARRRLEQGAWPTTGAEAVRDSVSTGSDEFFLGAGSRSKGQRDDDLSRAAEQAVRCVANRSFYKVDNRWIEGGLAKDWEHDAVKVAAFGGDYFALLEAHPELKEVFALATNVVFRLGAQVYAIEG